MSGPTQLTILMPCLNEAETLARCIEKAKLGLQRSGVRGEIVIADNGSTDGSQAIAEKAGVHLVPVKEKGYGSALIGGVKAAAGEWIIMGDADQHRSITIRCRKRRHFVRSFRSMKRLLTFIACLMLLALSARATTWTIAATEIAITNILATGVDGDTIIIQTGTVTLTRGYIVGGLDDTWGNKRPRSFTIHGSGLATHIVSNGSGCYLWFNSVSTNGNLLTVSDGDWIGTQFDANGMLIIGANPGAVASRGQFHVYNIQMTNCANHGMDVGGGDTFGCIDHCNFITRNGTASFNPIIVHGNAYASFLTGNPLGTTNVVCIEDCTFTNLAGNIGNGFFDCYNGSQALFRHCIFWGVAANGAHGYDSQLTSMRTLEIYNNVFDHMDGNSAGTCVSRGGVFIYESNQVYITSSPATKATVAPSLQYYRGANGKYQGGLGYARYGYTNFYRSTATSGALTSLTDTNSVGTEGNGYPGGAIHFLNEYQAGWSISIISATGSGQTKNTGGNNPSQTISIAGSFSPIPDNTSVYQMLPLQGCVLSIGQNNPRLYTLTSSITGGANIDRYVLIGANLTETFTNLMSCMNLDPAGAGVRYAAATTVANYDMRAILVYSNATQGPTIVYTNILDGTGAFYGMGGGYPAAFQSGVLNVQQGTNIGVSIYPCYSGASTVHDVDSSTAPLNFLINFNGDPANGLNFVTNLIVLGRDYFTNTLPPYTPLAYPHPLDFLDGLTNEYWIGTTPPFTNKANCSASVPLDGSTYSNFDFNMQSIAAGETIHLLAGTFQTGGDYAWGPKTGMHILGAGMTSTTIQFPSNLVASGSLHRAHVLGVQSPYLQTNIFVSDLTLDANYQTGVVSTLFGMVLPGSGNTISNVLFINGASFTTNISTYVEEFGIFISEGGQNADFGGNLITGCIVSNFTSNFNNNQQGIGINGYTSGVITNCSVYQNSLVKGVDAFAASYHDTIITGCSSFDCAEGTHSDATISITNVTYSHCNFVDCQVALDYENAHITNLVFDSNVVLLKNGNGLILQSVLYMPANSTGSNLHFINNYVQADGALSAGTFFNIVNVDGLFVCNNTYDSSVLTNNCGSGVFNVQYCTPATTGPFEPNR